MSEPIFPTLPPLPVLAHPSTFSGPDAPSQLLIEESRRHLDQLDAFREQLLGGSIEYPLSPPSEDALPPLPPIPLPPLHQTYRASSTASSSKRPKPNTKPPVPPSSYLSQAQTVPACIAAFNNAQRDGEGAASLHFADSAVLVDMASAGGPVAWILLRRVRLDGRREDGSDARTVRIQEVRIHASPLTGKTPPIHAIPIGPFETLSKQLTHLDLTLSELLYRLPEVASLLNQSCFYCQQHLRMPDGLPLHHTGLIGATAKSRLMNSGDGGGGDGAARVPAVKVGDKVDGEEPQARWVCWHASCDPPF